MNLHELWHVVVLGSALFGAAGAAVLFLGPLVFEDSATGLARFRPWARLGVAVAALVVALEWLGIH